MIKFVIKVFLFGFIGYLASYSSVEGYCYYDLYNFYACEKLNSTRIEYSVLNQTFAYYVFENDKNNTMQPFFTNLLSGINSIDDAFQFIKTFYNNLENCNPVYCKCQTDVLKLSSKWAYMFKDTDRMNLLKSYITKLENNLTSIVNNYSLSYGVTVLKEFCSKYEWDSKIITRYKETAECLYGNDTINNLYDCQLAYIFDGNSSNGMSIFDYNSIPNEKFTNLLKCFALSINCNPNLERFLILDIVLYKPSVANGDLKGYIESIINPSNTQVLVERYTTWVSGDPHIFSFKKSEREICNFVNETVCLKSDTLEIYCTGDYFSEGSSVTLLTGIRIVFEVDGKEYSYQAKDEFPDIFSNDKSQILNSNNEKVVEIKPFFVNKIIFDATTNTHITIGKWSSYYYMLVRGLKDLYSQSTGVLVDGCPESLKPVVVRRKKRSTYDTVCKSEPGNEEYVSSKDSESMCVYDCEQTGSADFAQFTKSLVKAAKQITLSDVEVQNIFDKKNGADKLKINLIALVLISLIWIKY